MVWRSLSFPQSEIFCLLVLPRRIYKHFIIVPLSKSLQRYLLFDSRYTNIQMNSVMQPFTILFFMAILSLTCSAFSWSSVFGERSDIAEANAKAMEGGKVSSLVSNRKANREERGSSRNLNLSAEGYSRHASVGDFSPTIEKPLPEDSAVRRKVEADTPAFSNYVESTTVVVKGKLPHRTSKQSHNSAGSESNHKAERELAKAEVVGQDDDYSTLKKEIQDMTKQLGPEEPAVTREELRREEEKRLNDYGERSRHKTEHHSAVTEGIEQAILGLTNVYNVLRNSGTLRNAEADHDKSHVLGGAGLSHKGGEGNSTLLEEVDATTDNSAQQTNTTDSRSSSESDKGDIGDVGSKPAGGISLIALIAGFVVVGTIALLVIGYMRNRHEVQAQQAPLYPPRGPSFV